MWRAMFKGVAIGTLLFISLLGAGLLGFSPAFELALLFAFPLIYVVGPLFGLLASASLDGPAGGVAVVVVSAWAEFCVLAAFVGAALTRLLSNSSFKRDRREAAAP